MPKVMRCLTSAELVEHQGATFATLPACNSVLRMLAAECEALARQAAVVQEQAEQAAREARQQVGAACLFYC